MLFKVGGGGGYLPWVVQRIKDRGLVETLIKADRKEYVEKAENKRLENKEKCTAGVSHERALRAAQETIDKIYNQVSTLSNCITNRIV